MKTLISFAKALLGAIGRHNVGMLAAAVSFFGFSAMIPLLLSLIFGATLLVPEAWVRRALTVLSRALVPTLPSESSLLTDSIARLMELRSRMSWIALLSLLWTAIGGFVAYQQILDFIWGARQRRSFVLQYVVGFVTMTVVLLRSVVIDAGGSGWFSIVTLGSYIAFPVLLFLATYLSYRFLPSSRLREPYLWLGAAVSTVAIVVSRMLFGWYLGHLGQYQMIYGALTFVMLLLFWIYIVSNIVLIAAEFIVCLSQFRHAGGPDGGGRAGLRLGRAPVNRRGETRARIGAKARATAGAGAGAGAGASVRTRRKGLS